MAKWRRRSIPIGSRPVAWIKGSATGARQLDNDRILVAIPHPETPDVEPLAGAGGIDPTEDQRAVAEVELGQAVDRTSTIDSRSWRCCSVPPRCGSYPA